MSNKEAIKLLDIIASQKARIAELEQQLAALSLELAVLREAVGEQMNPCGECHLKPGETCDVCGAVDPRRQIDYSPNEV